jgi:hypothetical protein
VLFVARVSGVSDPAVFRADAEAAIAALASRPGWVAGRVGQALDDPACWLVVCEWQDVGSGRRAHGDHAPDGTGSQRAVDLRDRLRRLSLDPCFIPLGVPLSGPSRPVSAMPGGG